MFKPTARDIERFTCGDCWILAQEIERVTGYPAYSYGSNGYYDHHVWVRVRNQRLDIMGLQTVRDFNAKWFCDERVVRVDWDKLLDDWGDIETFKGSRVRARTLAKRAARALKV